MKELENSVHSFNLLVSRGGALKVFRMKHDVQNESSLRITLTDKSAGKLDFFSILKRPTFLIQIFRNFTKYLKLENS